LHEHYGLMTGIHNLRLHLLHLYLNFWLLFQGNSPTKLLAWLLKFLVTFFTHLYWSGIVELLISISLVKAVDLLGDDDIFIFSSFWSWDFLSLNNHFLAPIYRVIQISGGISAYLYTIAVIIDDNLNDSSSDPHEFWIWISLIDDNTLLTFYLVTKFDEWLALWIFLVAFSLYCGSSLMACDLRKLQVSIKDLWLTNYSKTMLTKPIICTFSKNNRFLISSSFQVLCPNKANSVNASSLPWIHFTSPPLQWKSVLMTLSSLLILKFLLPSVLYCCTNWHHERMPCLSLFSIIFYFLCHSDMH
jgi:hypothetical protein